MAVSPSGKPGILSGLARILHLHQLPQGHPAPEKTPASIAPSLNEIPPIAKTFSPAQTGFSASTKLIIPPVSESKQAVLPPKKGETNSNTVASPKNAPTTISNSSSKSPKWPAPSAPSPAYPTRKGMIITDYDRILDMVKTHRTIKLDEIARLLAMKEEQVAQELQTLEDNGLVEVKYPAFGEPLIYYKTPEV